MRKLLDFKVLTAVKWSSQTRPKCPDSAIFKVVHVYQRGMVLDDGVESLGRMNLPRRIAWLGDELIRTQ
jgi:hypothetical protein